MEISAGLIRATGITDKGNVPARVLQTVITGPDDVQTVQMVGQVGEECHPVDGSMVIILSLGESLKVGIASDDVVAPAMAKGGKRIYSIADGDVAAQVRLDPDGKVTAGNEQANIEIAPDGTVMVSNAAGSFTMSPAGVFTFNGTSAVFNCDVAVNGTLAATVDVLAGLISLLSHKTSGVTVGSGTSGAPVP